MAKIQNSLDQLTDQFQPKVELFLADAKEQGFNIAVFEAFRTQERQQELYAIGRTTNLDKKPVTWTDGKINISKHQLGQAVDIVFIVNNAPSWNGDYLALRSIASKYEIGNLGKLEYCHFEDNGIPYNPPIEEVNTDDFGEILQEFVDK